MHECHPVRLAFYDELPLRVRTFRFPCTPRTADAPQRSGHGYASTLFRRFCLCSDHARIQQRLSRTACSGRFLRKESWSYNTLRKTPQSRTSYWQSPEQRCRLCRGMHDSDGTGSVRPRYRREAYYIWTCQTKSQKGASACPSKNIPEKMLQSTTAEVLGLVEFDEAAFSQQIEEVIVIGDDTLTFRFYDGHEVTAKWQSTAKTDWWTDERRMLWGERHKRKDTNPNKHLFYEFTGFIKCGCCLSIPCAARRSALPPNHRSATTTVPPSILNGSLCECSSCSF